MLRKKSRFYFINHCESFYHERPIATSTMAESYTKTDLQGALPLVARGKVRDLYEVDEKTLLFVATDRISAYDVIMENVSTARLRYGAYLLG